MTQSSIESESDRYATAPGQSDIVQIAAVDARKASKMLKRWVEQGVLLRDDSAGKRHTVYRKPLPDDIVETASSLSLTLDNGSDR